jgi:hypothetical protein
VNKMQRFWKGPSEAVDGRKLAVIGLNGGITCLGFTLRRPLCVHALVQRNTVHTFGLRK